MPITQPSQPLRVLAVDDDDVDRLTIQRALRRAEFPTECSFARDGLEALEILRSEDPKNGLEHPFLILLDLNMPRLDGHGFLEQLRADQSLRRTTVFVLTTSDFEEDQRRAYDLAVAGYIVKSNAGHGMKDLVDFLGAYWSLVSPPPV